VQVCTLYRCFWHNFTSVETHSPQGGLVRSCMRSLFLVLGDKGGVGQLVYAGHLLLAWTIFFTSGKIKILFVFCLFLNGGRSVCVCTAHTHTHSTWGTRMWVQGSGRDAHTHTHCTWGARCEPRGRDEKLGRDWRTQMDLGMCESDYVYKLPMYICMLGGGMRSRTNCFFSSAYIFFRRRKAKVVNVTPRTQIYMHLSYTDPLFRVLNYCSK